MWEYFAGLRGKSAGPPATNNSAERHRDGSNRSNLCYTGASSIPEGDEAESYRFVSSDAIKA
jgi:hypothetical protein